MFRKQIFVKNIALLVFFMVHLKQIIPDKHIEPQSWCGHLGGPHEWTHLRKFSHVVTCVTTPVDGTTHVDTCPHVCPHVWAHMCLNSDNCVLMFGQFLRGGHICGYISTYPHYPQVWPHLWKQEIIVQIFSSFFLKFVKFFSRTVPHLVVLKIKNPFIFLLYWSWKKKKNYITKISQHDPHGDKASNQGSQQTRYLAFSLPNAFHYLFINKWIFLKKFIWPKNEDLTPSL